MQDQPVRPATRRTFRLTSEADQIALANVLADDPRLAAGRRILNRLRRDLAQATTSQPGRTARAQ